MPKVVNVILHGIFAYVFDVNHIEVYVPAVTGHIYKVSRDRDVSTAKPLPRGDYVLSGVKGNRHERQKPNGQEHPVLPLKQGAKIDEFNKRYCKITMPYPAKIEGCDRQICPLDTYNVGSIFAGRDATPLNAIREFPSLHTFVYQRSEDTLELRCNDGAPSIDLTENSADPRQSRNLHIWCTTPPRDTHHPGMTAEGHLRRGFAALVDLVPHLEVTMQIPDGFSPTAGKESLPTGVDPCDVDPGRERCVHFGKVNCHYANLMFWPEEQVRL